MLTHTPHWSPNVEGMGVPDPARALGSDVGRSAGYRSPDVTLSRRKRRPILDLLIGVGFIVGLALGIGYLGLATAIALWLCVFIPVLTYLDNQDEIGESDDAHLEQKSWGELS